MYQVFFVRCPERVRQCGYMELFAGLLIPFNLLNNSDSLGILYQLSHGEVPECRV